MAKYFQLKHIAIFLVALGIVAVVWRQVSINQAIRAHDYHEDLANVLNEHAFPSLRLLGGYDEQQEHKKKWSSVFDIQLGPVEPDARLEYVQLRMQIAMDELLPWIMNNEISEPYFFNRVAGAREKDINTHQADEVSKGWQNLYKVGVKYENIYCAFRLPYRTENAPVTAAAIVEDLTSPTLILSVRALRADRFKTCAALWGQKAKTQQNPK